MPDHTISANPTDLHPQRLEGSQSKILLASLARLSEVEEVAATVVWLASDEASNVSGICLQSNIRSAGRRPT